MPRKRRRAALTAEEFRSELRRLNLTQAWFAEQCGYDRVTVSNWATGADAVPQHAWYTLQLLDRLAYRNEASAVQNQVEAFVRMITAQTLVPSATIRDASDIVYTGKRVIVTEVAYQPFRVIWRDPKTGALEERWYSHQTAAYRRRRLMRDRGIKAELQYLPTSVAA